MKSWAGGLIVTDYRSARRVGTMKGRGREDEGRQGCCEGGRDTDKETEAGGERKRGKDVMR